MESYLPIAPISKLLKIVITFHNNLARVNFTNISKECNVLGVKAAILVSSTFSALNVSLNLSNKAYNSTQAEMIILPSLIFFQLV